MEKFVRSTAKILPTALIRPKKSVFEEPMLKLKTTMEKSFFLKMVNTAS